MGLNMMRVWTDVPMYRAIGQDSCFAYLIPGSVIIIPFLLLGLDNAPFSFYLILYNSTLRSCCEKKTKASQWLSISVQSTSPCLLFILTATVTATTLRFLLSSTITVKIQNEIYLSNEFIRLRFNFDVNNCGLCDVDVENLNHIFFHCHVAHLLWNNFRTWLQ